MVDYYKDERHFNFPLKIEYGNCAICKKRTTRSRLIKYKSKYYCIKYYNKNYKEIEKG